MELPNLYRLFLDHPFITTDSRRVIRDSIFFALRGQQFDGNRFAGDALEKGCAFAVVDEPSVAAGERFILVKDVLASLQELSAFHRSRFNMPVLAITGSNGKTTTKELCHAVLSSEFRTVATTGNLNNHIGVPHTLLSISPQTQVAVVEMGANHPGEIAALCRLARPDLGIITNIGRAHLEGFGSFEGIVSAKKELYDHIARSQGTLFVNSGNPLLMDLSEGINRVTYGPGSDAILNGVSEGDGLLLKIRVAFRNKHDGTMQEMSLETQLTGDYNLENVLAAMAVGLFFNIKPEKIAGAVARYRPDNMRSEVKDTPFNRIILDAYNANPTSMETALRHFSGVKDQSKWLILGDMRELGPDSHKEHGRIVQLIRELSFQRVILIGEEFYRYAGTGEYLFFNTTTQAYDWLKKHPVRHATVLIKGSRLMKLEMLVELL
jgi:UDP-N-acetylmuramoyl-tripeptide--D-alanyl-D-alanine ligase